VRRHNISGNYIYTVPASLIDELFRFIVVTIVSLGEEANMTSMSHILEVIVLVCTAAPTIVMGTRESHLHRPGREDLYLYLYL
jgi:hypothetical protein